LIRHRVGGLCEDVAVIFDAFLSAPWFDYFLHDRVHVFAEELELLGFG
jgi:hypothetical protein